VTAINALQQSPFWSSTAVIIAYDDSDGWYDHQEGASIINGSFTTLDSVTATNHCGTSGITPVLPGPNSNGQPVQGRCSPGVRTPLLVISPWAKANFIDSTLTIQTSITRFIEDNWNLGRIGGGSMDSIANPINNMFNFAPSTPPNATPVILNPVSGLPE
jgi:phospholipase C